MGWFFFFAVNFWLQTAKLISASSDLSNIPCRYYSRIRFSEENITSPDYPKPFNKPICVIYDLVPLCTTGTNELHCTTFIRLNYINISSGSRCERGFVEITDHRGSPLYKFCDDISMQYMSVNGKFALKFISYGYSGSGFKLDCFTRPTVSPPCIQKTLQDCAVGDYIDRCCSPLEICIFRQKTRLCPAPKSGKSFSCTNVPRPALRCKSARTKKEICLPQSRLCDGVRDCDNWIDEKFNIDSSECSSFIPQIVTTARSPGMPVGRIMNSTYGFITSPGYPGTYPRGSRCEWLISYPGETIQLTFTKFKLSPSDNIRVYEVDGVESNLLDQFSFYRPPYIIFTSGRGMRVKFVSFDSWGFGFKAVYQLKGTRHKNQLSCGAGSGIFYPSEARCDYKVDCPDTFADEIGCPKDISVWCKNSIPCSPLGGACYPPSDRCNGFSTCRQQEYKSNADEIGCSKNSCSPHNGTYLCPSGACIYQSYMCDGRRDCRDGSDEKHCPVSRVVIIASAMGSTLCVLMLVVLFGCSCRLSRYLMERRTSTINSMRTRLRQELARTQAPPTYDDAMASNSHPVATSDCEYGGEDGLVNPSFSDTPDILSAIGEISNRDRTYSVESNASSEMRLVHSFPAGGVCVQYRKLNQIHGEDMSKSGVTDIQTPFMSEISTDPECTDEVELPPSYNEAVAEYSEQIFDPSSLQMPNLAMMPSPPSVVSDLISLSLEPSPESTSEDLAPRNALNPNLILFLDNCVHDVSYPTNGISPLGSPDATYESDDSDMLDIT